MSNDKPKYQQEVLQKSNRTDHAASLLRQAGELMKPYDSECLGSFSFHFFAEPNRTTGNVTVGFVNCSTEINVRAEILNQLLTPLRNTLLKLVGADLKTLRPPTEGELEEAKEKASEIIL